jgi:hypothetical protein
MSLAAESPSPSPSMSSQSDDDDFAELLAAELDLASAADSAADSASDGDEEDEEEEDEVVVEVDAVEEQSRYAHLFPLYLRCGDWRIRLD